MPDRGTALAVALAVACIGNAGRADEPRIEDVLAAHPPRPDVACGFTVSFDVDDHAAARVQRFTPPNRWELLSEDGAPPSKDALQDHAFEAFAPPAEQLPGIRWRELVDPGGSSVVSEDADTLTFSFQPAVEAVGNQPATDDESDIAGKLRGLLTARKEDLQPMQLAIENTAPFAMVPTVQAQTVRRHWTFEQDPVAGVVVRSMELGGRFEMELAEQMVELDLRFEFSDYDCQRRGGLTTP